jgi:hypothetical protein
MSLLATAGLAASDGRALAANTADGIALSAAVKPITTTLPKANETGRPTENLHKED